MSKLYWMDKVIAVSTALDMPFDNSEASKYGVVTTSVQGLGNELASKKTGLRMEQHIGSDQTTCSFTNTNFTDSMYIDYYTSINIELTEFPTYNDSTKTVLFKFKAPGEACSFRLVATF